MRLGKVIDYVKRDIWRIRLRGLSRNKSFLIKFLRIIILTIRGFLEDKCQLRASALTFYSVLSIVPVAAMIFGVAKGFQVEEMLKRKLMEEFASHQEVIQPVLDFADRLLKNTRGGVVAGFGIIILFWTVIKLLGNIEKSFNDIWGVKHPRPFLRKLTDYLSIMLICPILFIMASSVTVFISSKLAEIVAQNLPFMGPVTQFFMKFIPWVMIWLLFTFMYVFMPNTKVKFTSGLMAGIVAGSMYQILQVLYIIFQIGFSNYDAIYGSFAALPLFLIWMQLSWLIVLFGAEISFAHQNVDTYEFEPDSLRISNAKKRLFTLYIMQYLIKNFDSGSPAASDEEVSQRLEIPIRLVRDILFSLEESGLVCEVVQNRLGGIVSFQPAMSADKLTISNVLERIDSYGSNSIPVAQTAELDKLAEKLKDLNGAVDSSAANVLLRDI